MSTLAEAYTNAQKAALRASIDLPGVMGLPAARIYDVVPTNAPMPYIVIGEDQILDDDIECGEAAEIFSTVHVWAKGAGAVTALPARQIGDALKVILNAKLPLAGYVIDDWERQDATYITDPDGSTHGRFIFHYLVREA